MFDFIRSHTRIALFALVLLIIPSFVFFGIQGYTKDQDARNHAVATVAGQDITQAQVDAAHAQQIERLRRQIPNLDVRTFDTPEMKAQTVQALINERLILAAADKAHFGATDERLLRVYLEDPQFAPFRNPDGSVNKDLLQGAVTAQGMTLSAFEASLRQDIALRQVLSGINGSALGSRKAADVAFDALYQQREVEIQRFEAKAYEAKVTPTAAEIEAYYKDAANAARFQSTEQVDVEYVSLDLESLKKGIQLTDAQLREHYTKNESRYAAPEERRASHILITAPRSAPEAERKQARAKAEGLLAEVRKNPASFAEVARKNSQDEGSAARGGDIDFFNRGATTKPFEDAAYAMKVGEISDVVESDFGFHIIQLTQVRGGEKRPFESVRAEIENEVRQQLAQQQFSEAANEFTNTVYEQSESLKPVADKLKLEVKSATGVTRSPNPDAPAVLASPKLLEAVFSDDVLNNKRNTEAIETGPNQLVAARVTKYRPAAKLSLAEVTPQIRAALVEKQAAALARKDGEARLAEVRKAPATSIGQAVTVARTKPQGLSPELMKAVLQAPAASLPAIEGVELAAGGYAVVRVTKVLGRDPTATGDVQGMQGQYAQAWANAEAQAYTSALRDRFKVKLQTASAASAASAPR